MLKTMQAITRFSCTAVLVKQLKESVVREDLWHCWLSKY